MLLSKCRQVSEAENAWVDLVNTYKCCWHNKHMLPCNKHFWLACLTHVACIISLSLSLSCWQTFVYACLQHLNVACNCNACHKHVVVVAKPLFMSSTQWPKAGQFYDSTGASGKYFLMFSAFGFYLFFAFTKEENAKEN